MTFNLLAIWEAIVVMAVVGGLYRVLNRWPRPCAQGRSSQPRSQPAARYAARHCSGAAPEHAAAGQPRAAEQPRRSGGMWRFAFALLLAVAATFFVVAVVMLTLVWAASQSHHPSVTRPAINTAPQASLAAEWEWSDEQRRTLEGLGIGGLESNLDVSMEIDSGPSHGDGDVAGDVSRDVAASLSAVGVPTEDAPTEDNDEEVPMLTARPVWLDGQFPREPNTRFEVVTTPSLATPDQCMEASKIQVDYLLRDYAAGLSNELGTPARYVPHHWDQREVVRDTFLEPVDDGSDNLLVFRSHALVGFTPQFRDAVALRLQSQMVQGRVVVAGIGIGVALGMLTSAYGVLRWCGGRPDWDLSRGVPAGG